MSQGARVLEVLADGKPHSVPDIHRKAGTMRLNSRVADLRKQGHNIVCEHVKGKTGASAYRYTWIDAPPQPATVPGQLTLTTDEIAPRTENERYRLFRVRNGGPPEIVCTVSSPEAVGVALCTLGAEGEWDDVCVGVQDALSRFDNKQQKWVGKWLVKPWVAQP
jgi:hypothetical protein